MDAKPTSEQVQGPVTTTDRHSDREVVVTRTFDAPARIVFDAWTTPELIMKWWTPKSFGITFISCEADVRVGGTYRFVMGHPAFDHAAAQTRAARAVIAAGTLTAHPELAGAGALLRQPIASCGVLLH